MRILLVYPNVADHPKDISFGLAAISARLRQAGHTPFLLDNTFGLDARTLPTRVAAWRPELVGVTVATNDFDRAVELARAVRAGCSAPVVAGGFHATVAPDDLLALDCFEAVAVGEGEASFLELANAVAGGTLDPTIPGLWFRVDGSIVRNPLRPLNPQPGAQLFPDRTLFDYPRYLRHNRGLATFLSTLGCPYPCSYCINHRLQQMFGAAGYVRHKPLEALLAEIREVVDRYDVRGLEFYDETFTLDRRRVLAFCEQYGHAFRLPFAVNARAGTLDAELVRELKAAGCHRLLIGIECGNARLRAEVLRRPETDEEIVRAFEFARRAGLDTQAYNMVGLPFETEADIRQTVALNRRCQPDFVTVSMFNAYPGTDLHRVCAEHGWLEERRAGNYFRESNLRHPHIPPRRLKRLRDRFGYEVFRPTRPVRALVDLLDKKLLAVPLYHTARSRLIRAGARRWLKQGRTSPSERALNPPAPDHPPAP